MVIVHSATKGLAAMTLAKAHSRAWLDYEERVSAYWPEFAQQRKERITVRQLLAHQAGLFAFDEPVDRSVVADAEVAEYIESFYNRTRRHSHLGGLSPEQFEAAHVPRRQRLH
jgi:CubicO group peptidase (beta-lactamase class C family)